MKLKSTPFKTVRCVPSILRPLVLFLKSTHSLMKQSQSKNPLRFISFFLIFLRSEMKVISFYFSLLYSSYGLPLETIQSDFKSGLEGLLKEKPTKAIFIGTRIGDP